ncbi:MAG: glycolate oxidase subunit GlcF [Rhodospirillales bacterium]|jgi:glycolate oxidase iron-sulfur subunit
MQTNFSLVQLTDPDMASSESILRSCVHCGFCTATCPTYVLLGDELDSPRGRIYQIKDMLESGRPAPKTVVKHVDRCLSCLSCMTTCPSGVHYQHLVDHARSYINETFNRPIFDRVFRLTLARILPYPDRFRAALAVAWFLRPFAKLVSGRIGAMLRLVPKSIPPRSPIEGHKVHRAEGSRRKRVALLAGCAQQVLSPSINEATIRLLNRHGVEVVVAKGAGCCGALVHHMGRAEEGHDAARQNVDAWTREIDGDGLDAIVINASGCGTSVKDYGFMLRGDPGYAKNAERVSALTKDIVEFMGEIGLQNPKPPEQMKVAYHSACSMQHGQQLKDEPKALLEDAGFQVVTPLEPHLCCGSAGVYNIMQPKIADQLKERKAANLARLQPDAVAAGNIGCIGQLQGAVGKPVLHTVELLDWATGGPKPEKLVR